MKKKMVLMVFILALGSQAIANNFAELNLKVKAKAELKVVFDGQIIPSRDYLISIKAVPPGKHSLQVYDVLRSHYGIQEHPLFIGEVFLPPNTVTNGMIKHQQFIIEEQFAINHSPPNSGHQHNIPGQNMNSYHPSYNGQYTNHQYGNYYNSTPQANHQQYNQTQAIHCGFVPQAEVTEVFPMNDQAFHHLKKSIKAQWFSDGQMAVFSQAASSNYFTSIQVKELIRLFTFSGEKLEVAKIAYTQTLDPENYFLVYESLEWNSSIHQLNNYIASL